MVKKYKRKGGVRRNRVGDSTFANPNSISPSGCLGNSCILPKKY